MDVTFATQDIFKGKYDGIVLFTQQKGSDAEAEFQKHFGNNLKIARTNNEFKGEKNEVFIEISPGNPRFALIISTGKEMNPSVLREASGTAAKKLLSMGARSIAIRVPEKGDAKEMAQATTEGALLTTYVFKQYRTQKLDDYKELEKLTVISDATGVAAKRGVDRGRLLSESCNFARDLQNVPSNDMTPADFTAAVLKMAKEARLKSKVLDRRQLEKQGYGGILSVGKGSSAEPRLVTLEHIPKKPKGKIVLVGKGVTFDAGGISLKPSGGMGEMKFDMSGAAVVAGIMRAISKLNSDKHVIGIMGLAENMPSGSAYKPGDVIKTKSGKTVEIENTDAEGRVVLADCLHLATTHKPDLIVDFATLTGAAIVALGDAGAAVMGTDDESIEALKEHSEFTGEKFWQLPLWDEYDSDLDSNYADMKNMGAPRVAGTIVAGLFLKRFVDDCKWVHMDIAGTAWTEYHDRYFTSKGKGGTAYGVRLMTEYITRS